MLATPSRFMANREPLRTGFWDTPLNDLLQQLQATPARPDFHRSETATRLYGPNSLERESRFGILLSFVRSFANLVDPYAVP